MNKENLKNPKLWSIVVPILLFFYAVSSTSAMFRERGLANNRIGSYSKVMKQASLIKSMREKKGDASGEYGSMYFDGVDSANRCAQIALVLPGQFRRGEFSKPTEQKDGTIEHRETYNLNGVKLLQVAQFIDYAERNFDGVRCTVLSVSHSQGKSKDNWDATLTIVYRRPQEG